MEKKTRCLTENYWAAEAIASNEDLLLQIFVHVPVRPLIRFKVVSKQWESLISDSEFAKKHTRNSSLGVSSQRPSGLFAYTDSQQFYFFSLCANNHSISSTPLSKLIKLATSVGCTLKVLQSCSGLLHCSLCGESKGIDVEIHMVYNPVRKKATIVPIPDYDRRYRFRCYHLVFVPLESPHFKVVCLKFPVAGYSGEEVLMYSSESKAWRSCCSFRSIFSMLDSGVLWNGGIYWNAYDGFLRFDMDSESMKYFQLPPKPRDYNYDPLRRYFGEWGGHFHSVQIKDQYTLRFIVRELDKNTFKWIVKYRVHLGRIISAFPEVAQKKSVGDSNDQRISYTYSVLAVVRRAKEEEAALVLAIPGKAISYNLCSKLIRDLGEFPYPNPEALRDPRREFITVHQYIETLSPF